MKRLTLLLFLFLAGCGSGGESEPQPQAPTANPNEITAIQVLSVCVEKDEWYPYEARELLVITPGGNHYADCTAATVNVGDVIREVRVDKNFTDYYVNEDLLYYKYDGTL